MHEFQIYLCIFLAASIAPHHTSCKKQESMTNKHLRIGIKPSPPFLTVDVDPNGTETPGSMLWEPVEYWQRARSFTFTLVRPPDDRWGHCVGKNNCTGLLGLVIRKEVDFAIGMYIL